MGVGVDRKGLVLNQYHCIAIWRRLHTIVECGTYTKLKQNYQKQCCINNSECGKKVRTYRK